MDFGTDKDISKRHPSVHGAWNEIHKRLAPRQSYMTDGDAVEYNGYFETRALYDSKKASEKRNIIQNPDGTWFSSTAKFSMKYQRALMDREKAMYFMVVIGEEGFEVYACNVNALSLVPKAGRKLSNEQEIKAFFEEVYRSKP